MNNVFGNFLVLMSLLFDGLTSSQTDKEHKQSGRDYAYSFMFSNNFVSLLANMTLYSMNYMYNHDDTLERVFADPVLLRDVIMIGTSGAVG